MGRILGVGGVEVSPAATFGAFLSQLREYCEEDSGYLSYSQMNANNFDWKSVPVCRYGIDLSRLETT